MLLLNAIRNTEDPIRLFQLIDDDKRHTTGSAFSIQNIAEVGLSEHNKMPGEWYGVSKMNEIFVSLNEAYNFSPNLSNNFLGKFKMMHFKDGQIITSRVLEKGLGSERYNSALQNGQIDNFYKSLQVNDEFELV